MKLRLINAVGFSLYFCFGCFISVNAQEMPPAQVHVVKVGKQFMAPKVSLKGNVVALKKGVIAAEVAGQVDELALVGARLNKAASIATINADAPRWRLTRAQARLQSLKADLVFRDSEVERFSLLAKKDNASKNQLQQAISIKEMLVQDINIAETEVKEANKAIDRSKVPAPYAGVITERMVEIGEFVNVGDPIARLVNTSQIEIAVPTPLDYFSILKQGDNLTVIRTSEEQLNLPIRSIVNVGDTQTRMVETRLQATDTPLVIGESVSVLIPKAIAQERIAIPRDALIIRGNQTFVYRVSNDVAIQIPITIAFSDNDWLSVTGDVNAGDVLITRGAERLQPNSPVVVVN